MGKGDNGSSGVSLGLCDVLFVVFLILKLCGLISWSWWWVFSPIWIPVAIILIVAFIVWFKNIFDKPSDHDWFN